jgi:hypothetical protein
VHSNAFALDWLFAAPVGCCSLCCRLLFPFLCVSLLVVPLRCPSHRLLYTMPVSTNKGRHTTPGCLRGSRGARWPACGAAVAAATCLPLAHACCTCLSLSPLRRMQIDHDLLHPPAEYEAKLHKVSFFFSSSSFRSACRLPLAAAEVEAANAGRACSAALPTGADDRRTGRCAHGESGVHCGSLPASCCSCAVGSRADCSSPAAAVHFSRVILPCS